jgi:hypothetical protein
MLAVIVATVLTLGVPASSWAYWRATAPEVTATLSAGTVAAPSGISCTTVGGTLSRSAQVSWPAVAGAASYRVTIANASGTTSAQQTVTSPTITITQGLLGDLLSGLIATLLGGNPLYVSVETVHTSGWISPTHTARQAVSQTLLPVGVKCGT